MPHEIYKYKEVINKVAQVLWKSYSKFDKLQEKEIKNQSNFKETFKNMYGLVGGIDVMVGENQHTNHKSNFALVAAELSDQIISLSALLKEMSKTLLFALILSQADLDISATHPLSINNEKTVFLTKNNSN